MNLKDSLDEKYVGKYFFDREYNPVKVISVDDNFRLVLKYWDTNEHKWKRKSVGFVFLDIDSEISPQDFMNEVTLKYKESIRVIGNEFKSAFL